jgi:flagellin
VSLASSLGAATLSSAANNVFIAAPPTVTVASNGSGNPAFDPTKTLTVDIERGSAGNEIHVTVHYDGVNRGSISGVTANLAANGVTTVDLSSLGLGFDLVLTNGATAPTLAPFIPGGGPKDTYTYAAVKGGSRILTTTASNVANSAGAAFAAGAALHNANTGVKFATTTASQGGRLTLKVSSYDKAAKTVTFRGIFGNGTDAGTVTMTQNNVVGATGMMAGWNLSGGLGIDAALTNISIGDEVDFDVVAASASNVQLVGKYGQAGFATGAASSDLSLTAVGAVSNASLLLEVEQIVGSTVTFKVTSNILNADGSTSTFVSKMLVTENASATDPNQVGLAFITQLAPGGSQNFKVGDKMAYNVSSVSQAGGVSGASADSYIAIRGRQAGRKEWVDGWSSGGAPGVTDSVTYADRALLFGLDTSKVKGQEVHFKNFYINEDNGTVYSGDITLSLNGNFGKAAFGTNLGTFTAAYLGQLAEEDVKLRDLDKFWNSEGRFLLQDAQTLTITQGDGARGSVTLYATDTLKDVAVKLNGAIAKQLGQGRLLSSTGYDSAAERFTTFVREKKPDTSEAVRGTFVIRSVIAGVNGEISFAGDEDLLKALSLNEIQASEENSFTVSVWDAHNGKSVANGVKITGNKLIDVVNENVDVTFDPMANIKITWNDPTKSFMLTKANGSYQTTLHLADNTTVFQIGANEGEDMGVNIGDMRAEALGLNQVLVTDRKAAARSVTVIDNALDKVSSQRAKLGAYQNRLEHTINNLTAASQNLTASESRIRDTDMAKEMMNFTKLQIMLQAGTSMLAQANAMPQNVLSLIR